MALMEGHVRGVLAGQRVLTGQGARGIHDTAHAHTHTRTHTHAHTRAHTHVHTHYPTTSLWTIHSCKHHHHHNRHRHHHHHHHSRPGSGSGRRASGMSQGFTETVAYLDTKRPDAPLWTPGAKLGSDIRFVFERVRRRFERRDAPVQVEDEIEETPVVSLSSELHRTTRPPNQPPRPREAPVAPPRRPTNPLSLSPPPLSLSLSFLSLPAPGQVRGS